MRKLLFVTILILACSFAAMAQDETKAQVFGGYQWTSVDFGSGVDRQNFNGWNAALDGYFTKNFGITADFSGNYKTIDQTDIKLYSYMFGPTFRAPMGKATPFARALFGAAHLSSNDLGGSDKTFAYAFGGGLDVNASQHVAIRIAQFDYVGTRFASENQKHFRYSGGIVFKF